MKCDLCNQEFANSEEVKHHQEKVHPMGEGEAEQPGVTDGMECNETERPEAAERRNR